MKTSKEMNNHQIAQLFRAIAAALEVKKKDLFHIRAYQTAADAIESSPVDLKILWQQKQLTQIPGIGASLAKHLDELFRTGKVKHFHTLTKSLPQGMFALMNVPRLGPKKAYKLAQHFQLNQESTAVNRLLKLAQLGKIRSLPNFGIESEKDIIEGIEEFKRRENRLLLPQALAIASQVINYLKQSSAVLRIDALGSLRRFRSTVGDIDLAVATNQSKKVLDLFIKYPPAKQVLASGPNTARLILKSGAQVDIKTQTPGSYGALLQHFTGSKSHNIHLRELALAKKWSLSEYGIKIKGKVKQFPDEASFYHQLGLAYIEPELREDRGEIEAALKNKLPKLVELKDIKGDLHTHSNYPWQSSHDAGLDSMEDIIKTALKLNYQYLGLGDHNPSNSAYQPKQILEEVKKRNEYIEQLKTKYENKVKNRKIILLKTIEIDILANGKLAIPDQAIDRLDFAVVSVHSSFRMGKVDMTKRILSGLAHPKAKILGHPTGRLLNNRESFQIDWEKIFEFCQQQKKILEINAWPDRLDLPEELIKQAIKAGIKLAINTDAHAADQLEVMKFGVYNARRGWAAASDIVNTLPFNQLKSLLL